jgi:hypothetical protein
MDMVDPQPTLGELLVRYMLLPRELLPQIEINSSKPDGSLNWRPIPFETLQVEILLPRKGSEVGARHGHAFMLDPMRMSRGYIISGIRRPSVLHTGEPMYVTTIREPSTRL